MHRLFQPTRRFAIALIAAAIGLGGPAASQTETYVGSNVDSRVVLAYKVPDPAARAWLPEGWIQGALPNGPFAGANLLVIFIDRHVNLDPEGEPTDPPLYSGVALVHPGIRGDEFRLFVTRIYLSEPSVNPYANTLAATVRRKATRLVEGATARGSEDWTVANDAGGAIELRLDYQGAVPGLSEKEARPYSNIEPDFHRIYRYQQIVELVRSVPAEVDRADSYAFTTSIPEMAPMFDGSEELIGIASIPWYFRRTYLP
jgi:hypothetical protein